MSHVPRARPSVSASNGAVLSSRADMVYHNPEIAEDHRVFNPLIHESEIHVPVEVLDVSDDSSVQGAVTDCLDMPIRMKGQVRYSIPDDWKALVPTIQKIIDIEHTNNSQWSSYYTYLSIHYSPHIEVGKQQRHAGCHTDGFQGIREPIRTRGSRSYVAVTNGGTRYYPQTFVAALDSGKYNIFEGFDLQVEKIQMAVLSLRSQKKISSTFLMPIQSMRRGSRNEKVLDFSSDLRGR